MPALEVFTIRLGGEHFLRRPLDHLRAGNVLDIDHVERFKLGLVERVVAHKPRPADEKGRVPVTR